MNIHEKDVLQGIKDLRLSERDRAHMRSELSAYADLHSLPSVEISPFNSVAFLSSIFAHSRTLVAGAMALVIVVATGGATAFASEKTVPGDVLYPVKIHVAEPIASVFAGTGGAKARFHATLAVKRVQEAEVLEQRGALTDERAEELAARFTSETDKAEAEAARLETNGDHGTSLAIRAELAQELLAHTGTESADTDDSASGTVATRSAKTAPEAVSMKAASVASTDQDVEKRIDFKKVVARKVALLLEVRAKNHALAIEGEEENDIAGEDDAEPTASVASRALLSGASVSADSASSSASSSPKEGARLLKALLKDQKDSREKSRGEEDSRTEGRVLSPETLIAPVQNPSRLIPTKSLLGE